MTDDLDQRLLSQVRKRAEALAPPRSSAIRWTAAALAALALALAMWWTRTPTADRPADAAVGEQFTWGGETTPSGSGSPPGVSTTSEVVVHVSGAVRSPGLVRLPPGSRVLDAITAAGGLLEAADADSMNLARAVTDGEQIVAGAPSPLPPGVAKDSAASPDGRVELNTASAAQLEELPGVGPVLAGRIVTWRTDNGPFRSVDELGEVSGIGESRLADLRELVRIG